MKKVIAVLLVGCLLAALPFSFTACKDDGGGNGGNGAPTGGQLPSLEVGDQWVWHYTMQGVDATLTQEITGEEIMEGRDCYVIDMSFDPLLTFPQAEGVSTITDMTYWTDKATVTYDVKQEMVGDYNGEPFTLSYVYSYSSWDPLFPLEIGKEVEMEQTTTQYMGDNQFGEPTVTTLRYRVDGMEDVTVAAGSFSCWRLVVEDGEGGIIQVFWWSDEVKSMVKSTGGDGNTTMELLSYSS
jgi:hypothetical protein